MILVIGGASSGKMKYLLSLGYLPSDIADGVIDERPVVYNLQNVVAKDPARCMEYVNELLQKEVVVCNEVGSGVIPEAPEERERREQTGRLTNRLAQDAERVVRLVCGISTVLKG